MPLREDEEAQLAATSSFISHFTSEAVGGYLHPSLTPQIDATFGLSIFASSSVGKEERLVSCPLEWVVTPSLARKAIETLCSPEDGKLDGWKETMLICGYICLHWAYRDGKDLPGTLQHWPYIQSLPPASTLRTPLQFTDAEMGLLEGSNLYGATLDRRRQWTEEWQTVKAVIGNGVTWDRFLTAATYIASRAFPSKLLSVTQGEASETTAVQTSEEEESHPVLIPGMDMFNHARGQPVTWLTSSTPTPSISLVTPSGVDSDVQVFNNYGPKPNEELLLGYGFVLPSNPDDVVALRLGGLNTNLAESKRRILEKKGLDPGKRWVIKRDGEIDRGMMEVLRVIMGDDHAHEHDHDSDDDEGEGEDEHGHWEEEMELELDVLGALGQMLEDKLVKLESVDESAVAREDVRAMCAEYRKGQIEILEKAMATVEERIERVERLTAEGQGCPCCN